MNNQLLEAALNYARRGWAVFPVKPNGKTPLTKTGFKEASKDETTIKMWWSHFPNANIGVATGAVSDGLVVIDIDIHDVEEISKRYIDEWTKANAPLPQTLTQITGSGGRHLFFRSNREFKSSTHSDASIDIRANGGYVIMPPSNHSTGGVYRWLDEASEIAFASSIVCKFIDDLQQRKKVCFTDTHFQMPHEVIEGGRNDVMFRFVASLQARGLSDDTIQTRAEQMNKERFQPPIGGGELTKIINSATSRYQKGSGLDFTHIPDEDFRQTLSTAKNRTSGLYVTNDLCNYVTVLENDPLLANHFFYDTRAAQVMLEAGLPAPFTRTTRRRAIQDVDYTSLQMYFEKLPFDPANDETGRMFNNVQKQLCIDAISQVAMTHERNLAAEWFDTLIWDGEPRMDGILYTFLGCAHDDYTIEVTRVLLYGIIARAFNAGVKFDYIPVLVGRQGLGKSQFCRALCPKEEWYLDGLSTMEGDDAIEKIRNKLIVEVAELANLRRDKLETVKSFLTRTVDTIRPKYAKNTEDRPRGCVFIGTTNVSQFLVDKTGNRRWLPVQCGLIEPPMSLFDKNAPYYFEQVWAEAVQKWREMKPALTLPTEILDIAASRQEAASEDDTRAGVIEQWLDAQIQEAKKTLNPERERCRVCARQIMVEVFNVDNPQRYEVSDISQLLELKIEGWTRLEKRKTVPKYGSQYVFIPTQARWGGA